ncbi:MAG TPA: hypothetical protein VF407_10220 [Polyangiaceae bacterium]
MIEKLDFLVRFWELKARHATLGEPLAQDEQQELLSLLQLVTSDLKVPEAGAAARVPYALPAQVIGEGRMHAVELRAVTAAALVISSATSLPVGAPVIVRTTDAIRGIEYALPCRVGWVHKGAAYTIALIVDGIPSRSDFEKLDSTPHVAPQVAYSRSQSWPTTRREPAPRRQ